MLGNTQAVLTGVLRSSGGGDPYPPWQDLQGTPDTSWAVATSATSDITYTGTNIVVTRTNSTSNFMYTMAGAFVSGVAGSINGSSVSFDGADLILGDTVGNIHVMVGLTATIRQTIALADNTTIIRSIEVINGDLCYISGNGDNPNHFNRCDGLSNVVIDHFLADDSASPAGARGMTSDGTNLITNNITTDKVYVHSGVSATISRNFISPDANTAGLTYDSVNLITNGFSKDKIYICDGVQAYGGV